MPELPEAEHTRGILEHHAVGRRITTAHVEDDPIVFDKRSPSDVEAALVGRRVEGAHRRGKYLWLSLDQAPHPIIHLGMTGQIRFVDDEPLSLESSAEEVDRRWPPRFTKLRLAFHDGGEVAFTNARRLGRVFLRDDPAAEAPIAKLGFDPLTDMPSAEAFAARLQRRQRAVLKSLLLDQGFSAGVGNWIADEVLYQARLDPRRRVGSLEQSEVERLRVQIREVVHTAVEADARKDAFPTGWLFHRRWGRKADMTTHDGHPIEYLEIGGRTTAWVPSQQG